MSGIYFSLLAILVLTGFFARRVRGPARSPAASSPDLHSLPTYHGLFAGSPCSSRC